MGGVAILLSILVVLLTQPIHADPWVLLPFFLLIGYGLIGLIDDLQKVFQKQNKGLSGKHKIFFQIVVASIFVGLLAAANHYSTAPELLKQLGPIGYYLLLVFIIVGTSNAVNLTDGLDGLVAGNLLIAFLGLLLFSFYESNYQLLTFIVAILGALFGFLWFNINPARIFMGDTGSLSLGALLAGISIILHKELPLVILGIVFVAEALSVIFQVSFFKLTGGKRLFKMSPLHHHFELCGWTENKIVVRFWMIGILALLVTLGL